MTLEAVVLQQDLFGYGSCSDFYTTTTTSTTVPWIHGDFSLQLQGTETALYNESWDPSPCSLMGSNVKEWDTNSTSQENSQGERFFMTTGFYPAEAPVTTAGGRKRKRSRSFKNQEEVEHQRMTHITVERNRRKQMNEFLAVLRSMMPPSYVQRGDQASIVGGAINFVKELEKRLQSLEAQKRMKKKESESSDFSSLFSDFFTFPQYSSRSTSSTTNNNDQPSSMAKRQSSFAEVEVTMIESHANLKILSRKHPKQLLKMVAGLSSLSFSILHLNVTTVGHMVLYSFSVKVEEECQLTTVNEIAATVYEMVGKIQDEAISNFSSDS